MPKTHQLTDEEYEKVKHLLDREEKKYEALEDFLGGIVFVRTVTHYYTGRVKKIAGNFLVLEDAAWIADTGRFGNFMANTPQESLEVEPMGDTMVNIETIVDISPYKTLLTIQK